MALPGRRPWWPAVALALKAALAGLLLFALVHPHWDRFADKAMGIRAAAYPFAALLVPLIWLACRRLRRPFRYPWDVDALVVAPFVIDVAGNAANLSDTLRTETVGIYRDTIGDEVLGLSGATLAGVLTAVAAARRPAVSPTVGET